MHSNGILGELIGNLEVNSMSCPNYQGDRLIKNGWNYDIKQRFKCFVVVNLLKTLKINRFYKPRQTTKDLIDRLLQELIPLAGPELLVLPLFGGEKIM